jgi:hypothetical protein
LRLIYPCWHRRGDLSKWQAVIHKPAELRVSLASTYMGRPPFNTRALRWALYHHLTSHTLLWLINLSLSSPGQMPHRRPGPCSQVSLTRTFFTLITWTHSPPTTSRSRSTTWQPAPGSISLHHVEPRRWRYQKGSKTSWAAVRLFCGLNI